VSISRVNALGWGVGTKLTSSQANSLDLNTTYAADKRSGQSDSIAAVWSAAGAGRLIGTYAVGADADTTYLVSNANAILDVPTLTATRVYTLSNTNAIPGDRLSILNRSGFYIMVHSAVGANLIVLGAQMQSDGESVWADFLFTETGWVLWKSALRPLFGATTFTAPGSYPTPRGVTLGLLIGWGGGGGGGGGGAAGTLTTSCALGGAGGGGALRSLQLVALPPGASTAVTPGTGGLGGATTVAGGAGGDTTFGSLATFLGAAPGNSGGSIAQAIATLCVAMGGGPVRIVNNITVGRIFGLSILELLQRAASFGGHSTNDATLFGGAGTGSPEGFAGGFGAANGGTTGSALGGQGGGGGGGGPGGPGTNGASGGAGGNAGSGAAGSTAANAAANSGAGGGGGGGGGQCTGAGSPGTSGGGGNGGSGQVTVIPLR
jgi:hypothetical protein